jgi:Crinkler effector protein N-terminal domain
MSDPHFQKIYTVVCIIADEEVPFAVEIAKSKIVGVLQDMIKEKRRDRFQNTPAPFLALHHVDIVDDDNLVANMATQLLGSKLRTTTPLANIFDGIPKQSTVHFIVQPPKAVENLLTTCIRWLAALNLISFFRLVTTIFQNSPDSSSRTNPNTIPLLDDNQAQVLVSKYELDLRQKMMEFLHGTPAPQLPLWEPLSGSDDIQRHITGLKLPTLHDSRHPSLLLHNLGQPSHDPKLVERVNRLFNPGGQPRYVNTF